MTAEQREKLSRWIDAYLDGRLTPEQSAQFGELLKRSPGVRAEIELQANIDGSLRRQFAPPATASLETVGVQVIQPATPDDKGATKPVPARRKLVSREVWLFTAAASLLILVAFGSLILTEYFGDPTNDTQPYPTFTLTEAYRASEQGDFKAAWLCKDEQEFATTFHWQLGQALAMAKPPEGMVPEGLSYVRIEHSNAPTVVEIIARVNGQGVIVFVDKRPVGSDQCRIKVEAGLNVFEKQTDHLILREVTPLERSTMLELLDEREIPDEWKKTPPGYSSSGSTRRVGRIPERDEPAPVNDGATPSP